VNLIERRLLKLGANVKTEGMPKTLDDLRDLKHFEFQNFIIKRVHGTHSPRKTGDMGIDGYSFFEGLPIQVKQSEKIGRNVIDNFETAIRRDGNHKGYVIAFSFGSGAYAEAARVKREGLEIALVEVATLIDVSGDITPRPGLDQLTADLLQGVRAAETELKGARPDISIEELVASDQGVG
jgi:Restriction endonuclease